MLDFEEMWAVPGGSGGGGESTDNYVKTGLVYSAANTELAGVSQSQKMTVYSTPFSVDTANGVTAEIYARPDSIPNQYGRFLDTRVSASGKSFIALASATGSAQKGANADYGINIFSDTMDYTIKVDNLVYGDKHTISVTAIDGGNINLYLDGALLDARSFSRGLTTMDVVCLMMGMTDGRSIKGQWFNARIYGRVLTAEEIVANHAEDIRLYGENA